jgi:4-diphosphocytidyl-2-C-methyl-D-erythritol kinase
VATRPERLRVAAPAKINLNLHVTGKRPDGYHDLQSLVAFADVGDVLVLERSTEFSLAIDGPFAAGLAGDADNLILSAARALRSRLSTAAHFRLTKNLPVASGIGGGSADAAAAFRGLFALDGKDFTMEEGLAALAATLGSDIPVCLDSTTAWMEGRGEMVTRLPPLPATHIVLVNPGVSVATAEVFRRLAIREGERRLAPPSAFGSMRDLIGYLKSTRNDLEAPARAIAPVVGTVLDTLAEAGALFVRMSGSGATCFGLFESAALARDAASAIGSAQPAWWSCAGKLAGPRFAEPQALS